MLNYHPYCYCTTGESGTGHYTIEPWRMVVCYSV